MAIPELNACTHVELPVHGGGVVMEGWDELACNVRGRPWTQRPRQTALVCSVCGGHDNAYQGKGPATRCDEIGQIAAILGF